MSDEYVASISSPSQLTLAGLIGCAAEKNASDLFLKVGSPPGIKCLGKIVKLKLPALDEQDVKRLAFERTTPANEEEFHRTHELNLSFTVPNTARIRQNVYQERDCIASTLRLISLTVRSLDEIGVESKAVRELTKAPNGLVLVTGPTGSGKTTTLAGMIDYVNETRPVHIVTIEDPIEYTFQDKMGFVSQRQVGVDTFSFAEGFKQVLRQTPDVILFGEMRDEETLNIALQAAETGHLVFGTIHTSSAAETLDRISNMYPPHERPLLWLRLAVCLRGVISQKLVKRADESGRVVAQEIMVVTPTVSKLLEEGKSEDLYTAIRHDGQEGYWGMQTMNQHLERYVVDGTILEEDALLKAGNLTEMKQMLRRRITDNITSDIGPKRILSAMRSA